MNLSLTQKILLVVAIPFAIQLVFLGILSQKLNRLASAQTAEERLAKVTIAQNLYLIDESQLSLLACVYMITHDRKCRDRAFQVCADVVRLFNDLSELWKNDPEKRKALNTAYADHVKSEAMARKILDNVAPTQTVLELFGNPFGHAYLRSFSHRKDLRTNYLRPSFEQSEILKAQEAATIVQTQREIYLVLTFGLLATVIASVVSGLWFSISVTRRLKVVLANIETLKESKSELVTIHGNDEISNLNASVVSTANKISDAKDFQAQTIAIIAEELSAPLSEIDAAFVELRQSGFEQLSAKGAERLHGANAEISRLDSLVSELVNLDIARRTSNITKIDLAEIAANCIEIIDPLSKTKNLTVILEPCAEIIAWGDHDKTMQVLLNLLSNAIKYSAENSTIEIIVDVEKEHGRVSVVDHGQGIPDEFHSRIFQRFEQAESSHANKPTSSGLGLAISKEIIESQGGEIVFSSKLGSGSNFWFTLPQRENTATKQASEHSSTGKPGWKPTLWKNTILVVALPILIQGITVATMWKFLEQNSEKIFQFEKIPKITAIHAELMDGITRGASFALLYNVDRDADSLTGAKTQFKKMLKNIAELEKITTTENGGADKLTSDLVKSIKTHIALDEHLLKAKANAEMSELLGNDDPNKAKTETLYIDTQAPLQALVSREYKLMDSTAQDVDDISRNFELLLIGSAIATSLLSAALGLSIARSLTKRTQEIAATAIQFSDHRTLSAPKPGDDELAFVATRLYEAEKKLMELEVYRAEMIGITGHELRTPLTSLMALSELIENGIFGTLNERGEQLISHVRLRISELIVLITNLLDLEKMESGKLLVTKQPIVVDEIFENVKADVIKLAEEKGVTLSISPCTVEVNADGRRVSQSLIAIIQTIIHRAPALSEIQVDAQQSQDTFVISISAPHGVAVKGFNKNKEFAREKMAFSLARLTAQQHGGDFSFTTSSKGRSMVLSLPFGGGAR